ncbi:MAG: DEAD/DEAH box helicase [bacterium]|nr:DEAD/DEAH box helicase [bacterium]
MILEEKTALGLAVPPPEGGPVESLTEQELICQAIEARSLRASEEKMRLTSTDPGKLWTDYTITSALSGKTYRVALRGWQRYESYCSCPDFRKNTLGTCKHILSALGKVKRRFPARVHKARHETRGIAVHLAYGQELELRLLLPELLDPQVKRVVRPLRDRPINDVLAVLDLFQKLSRMGVEVTVFPDAEEYIQQRLFQHHIEDRVAQIRKDPKSHPLIKELLKAELLPYQLDGIAFAVGAGRAVLADDMGLGKTIQGIGVAELLAREAGISKVLVICPASLKSQWRSEIHRFSDRSCQLVLGSAAQRALQYGNDGFFTICNYEQVLRDILPIEQVRWDLIVLDEGQRIKNWEARTSQIVKSLRPPFALVLSGTPLENRLDDLFSVVEFIDDRRLGPAFRFFNRHRVVDERGKVLGYQNLAELRQNLSPVLLRRTRASVMQDLPPRTTQIIRITPTDEQATLHLGHMQTVSTIIRKKYISEMDLLRLQKALLMCRMSADSTFLVDKQPPGYSSKLEELENLLVQLFLEDGRKVVLFSEWTTMLDLIEQILTRQGLAFVRLDGSVPQQQRRQLVHQFQADADCRLFITTNAGSTGLNLQAANTVINVDLPWNPAVLEQRISRAHRMGQKSPVQVFVLITEDTIEERLLTTLSAKHELALAALDTESDVDVVDLVSGMEELKRRLEVLLGARPEAPVDESRKAETERETERLARQDRISTAGGQLLTAAFGFLGELVPQQEQTDQSRQLAQRIKGSFADCLEKDAQGRPRLTITLPDESALDSLANSLAAILARASG